MRRRSGISLSLHGVTELLMGLAVLLSALVVEAGTAGALTLFVAGTVIAGMGLGATEALPVGLHQSLDALIVTLCATAAAALALAGEPIAPLVLIAGAGVLLVLTSLTRWSRPVARPRLSRP